MVNTLPVFSISAGIYTMVVISVERVRCVLPVRGQPSPAADVRALGVRGTLAALAVVSTMSVVWTMSVLVAVPAAVSFDVGPAQRRPSQRHERRRWRPVSYTHLTLPTILRV